MYSDIQACGLIVSRACLVIDFALRHATKRVEELSVKSYIERPENLTCPV